MKKVLAISSMLLGVVFLAGCGQQPVSQTQPTTPAPVAQTTPAPLTPTDTSNSADGQNFTNDKYGFKFKYSSSQCLLSQEQPAGLFVELYKDGQCPTLEERGDLGTLTFKYNYDSISAVKFDLPLNEYIKNNVSNIKIQKSVVINNINWQAVYLNCDTKEGEPPACYGTDTFYLSKSDKNNVIYSIGTQGESSAQKIAKEWVSM